jgi:hypothetical protein
MVASGVESLRVVFNWADAEPTQGGPISFAATDSIVGLAAERRLTVLPVVIYAPAWDAGPHAPSDVAPPASDGPYADYLTALVGRYGPHGSYWAEHPSTPRVPIRMWQIWNEPNYIFYWPTRPFAPSYVRLVIAAHAAIKAADPGARVVLAGMPDFAWQYLDQIYKVSGARGAFDVVSANPYTAQPKNVIAFLQLVRKVMNRNGDARKPMLASETGWQSSLGDKPSDSFCCQTTEQGQAGKVGAVLPLLASHRRQLGLLGFYFYTWVGQEYRGASSFNFAGLFRFANNRLVAKPVFGVFRRGALALERCRVKGPVATRCSRPR